MDKRGDITDETPGVKSAAAKDEHPTTKANDAVRESMRQKPAQNVKPIPNDKLK